MSSLSIDNVPLWSCPVIGLPSVNTHYNKHFRARSVDTGEWRTWAKDEAGLFLWLNPQLERPAIKRALVVVNVFPPYEEISDIHNVHIKPILDGFTDAGLWTDDEWAFVPLVLYAWGGNRDRQGRGNKERLTVFEVHELARYYKKVRPTDNGALAQTLPTGRTWIDKTRPTTS